MVGPKQKSLPPKKKQKSTKNLQRTSNPRVFPLGFSTPGRFFAKRPGGRFLDAFTSDTAASPAKSLTVQMLDAQVGTGAVWPLKTCDFTPPWDPNGAAIYGNMDPINIPPFG